MIVGTTTNTRLDTWDAISSLVSRTTPMSRTVCFSCATDPPMLMVDVTGPDERKRMASVLSSFNRSLLSVSHRLRSSTHSVICLDASVWSFGGTQHTIECRQRKCDSGHCALQIYPRAQNTRRHAPLCRAAAVTCREALKICGRCAARLAAMPWLST